MSISGTNGELEMRHSAAQAFTLIELMVVIGIIVILLSLAFPVFQGVLERTKKVQAKNDLTQIVTAVNAFYTEYGRYPVKTTCTTTTDAYFGGGTTPSGTTSCGASDILFNELRAVGSYTINTRQIVFISPPQDTTQASPKGKIGMTGSSMNRGRPFTALKLTRTTTTKSRIHTVEVAALAQIQFVKA